MQVRFNSSTPKRKCSRSRAQRPAAPPIAAGTAPRSPRGGVVFPLEPLETGLAALGQLGLEFLVLGLKLLRVVVAAGDDLREHRAELVVDRPHGRLPALLDLGLDGVEVLLGLLDFALPFFAQHGRLLVEAGAEHAGGVVRAALGVDQHLPQGAVGFGGLLLPEAVKQKSQQHAATHGDPALSGPRASSSSRRPAPSWTAGVTAK